MRLKNWLHPIKKSEYKFKIDAPFDLHYNYLIRVDR